MFVVLDLKPFQEITRTGKQRNLTVQCNLKTRFLSSSDACTIVTNFIILILADSGDEALHVNKDKKQTSTEQLKTLFIPTENVNKSS